MIKHNKGFTLIELLTVIGIVAVLAAIAVPSYALMKKNVTLKNTAEEIVNTLRTAQNNAISSQDNVNWGVRFETDRYILCKADCSLSNYVTTYILNNGATIQATPLPVNIIFSRLNGTITNTQTINLDVNGRRKAIEVNTAGKITLTNL